MRVVGGSLGGRRLVAPPGLDTRPTSDRVRAAIFNALGSRGAIEGATVVDLFAGSGAMGIEAVSRGARAATFVERDRAAVECIRANLRALGVDGTVVPADAVRWIATAPQFDVAFVDPPYAFASWADLLEALPARLAVIESDRTIEVPAGWEVIREKRYGTTVVLIAERAS